MESTRMVGVGAGDIQHAVAAEVERILKQTKGDVLAQNKLLTGMLLERGLITDGRTCRWQERFGNSGAS
jgi:hypothetical protein